MFKPMEDGEWEPEAEPMRLPKNDWLRFALIPILTLAFVTREAWRAAKAKWFRWRHVR